LILDRNDSYIGVMIEDLISNTRDEPYRLFTARNENRLSVREDNSVVRMSKYRESLFLNTDIDRYNSAFLSAYINISEVIIKNVIKENDEFVRKMDIRFKERTTIEELLKNSHIDPIKTLDDYLEYIGVKVPREIIACVAINTKYSGYINKASNHYEKIRSLDTKRIAWEKVIKSENISFECKQRIEKIKPTTFGQLKLIDGLRPATLAVVAGM
jgi:tRNA uridine 5-carboxymethylaminomethyl modification enzyme